VKQQSGQTNINWRHNSRFELEAAHFTGVYTANIEKISCMQRLPGLRGLQYKYFYMKPRCFFILAFLLSLKSLAQPLLNQGNSLSDGITIHLFVDTAPTLSEGNGGANQTWDFSGLSDANAPAYYYGILASATPYAGDFPDAQIATLNISNFGDSIYSYFTNDATHYTTWGLEYIQQILNYTDPRDILHYPFTFGDSFTDSYLYTSPFNSDLGEVEVTADGYGTLLLPQGAFDNCLRVREVKRDTVEGEFWLNISNDTSYKFYSSAFPEPLCLVIHHHSSNLYSYSEIYWQDAQAESVPPEGDGRMLFSFPNPCNELLNIVLPSGNNFSLLQITDVVGRHLEIPSLVKNNSVQLNTMSLHDGVYFVSVKCGNKVFTVQFVKNTE